MRIEWPKGSGRIAEYTDRERAEVRAMIDDGATFGIPAAQVLREVTFIHELKVEMDARLVFETSADPVELPPPDSPFQIPASVRRSLELDAAS